MKTRVFNLLILDESGSMSSIHKQAVDSVNETLQTIREAQKEYPEQEHLVSFVTFNSCGIKTLLDRAEAAKAEDITMSQFQPNCGTPLYDAIGLSVNKLKASVADNEHVLVTIITDGYENASREYNAASVKALTEQLGGKGWTFAYIGANQDAEKVSQAMGIVNSMNFEASDKGTVEMCRKAERSRKGWFARLHDGCADLGANFFSKEDD